VNRQPTGLKRSHLIYTVSQLSRVLAQLHDEGYPLDPEAVAALSPYRPSLLDRFGHYILDFTQAPDPLEYDLPIFSTGGQ